MFDYTEHWQRALEKNTNEEMLDHYAEFGMRRNPKGFKGKVVETGCSVLPAGSTASYFVKTEATACLFIAANFRTSAIPSSTERPCFGAASGA